MYYYMASANKYLLLIILYYSEDLQFYSIENIAYELQKTEAQLQAALQRVMELNNGKTILSTI